MKLFSRQHGEGDQALIILHGLLGSSANWQSLAKRFGQKRHVYTLDLRNHGQSPWSDSMDYQVMAEDVVSLVDTLEHRHTTILGHSMGGKTAMQLALDYPDKLDKLIVADIAPISYQHDYRLQIESLLAIDMEALENRAQADDMLISTIQEPGMRAFLLHNLAYQAQEKRWHWRPNLEILFASMDIITGFANNQDKQFIKPTLFIHGAESDYVQPTNHPLITQLFPQSQIKQIMYAGHWLHAEQPQEFVAACEQFLSQTH